MRKQILIVLGSILLPLFVTARQQNVNGAVAGSPAKMGFSMDGLKEADILLKDYISKGLIPGVTMLVARHGEVVYQSANGFSDREARLKMRNDHIFRIASMTKPIVTAAILQLYEQGKLNFEDPLAKYIPAFSNMEILDSFDINDSSWVSHPSKEPITIHHLLTHTSGLSYGFTNAKFGAIYAKLKVPDAANPFDYTIHQALQSLARAPLAHEPGKRWTYGLSTDVLGAIVEIVSEKPLDQYISENILLPLGMKDTDFWLSDSRKNDLTTLYMPQGDTAIVKIPAEGRGFFRPNFPIEGAKKYHSGGSGLSSTAKDYFIFCQTMLNGGAYKGKRILKKSSIDLMTKNQVAELTYLKSSGFGFGYGYGLATKDSQDERMVKKGKYSWGGAFGTTFWIDPVRDLIVVLMTQVVSNPHKSAIENKIETIVNSSLIEPSK